MFFKKLIMNRKKILWSWITSYITMLLLPIIVSCGVYILSIKIINQQIRSINEMSIIQLQTSIDNSLKEINNISLNLLVNDNVKSIMYTKQPMGSNKIYDMSQLQNDIIRIMASNKIIDSLYIYFYDSNVLLTNKSVYYGNEISTPLQEDLWISYNEGLQILDITGYRDYKILKKNNNNRNQPNSKIAVIQKLFLTPIGTPSDVTVIVILNGDKLSELMDNINNNDENQILITDINDQTLSIGKTNILTDRLKYNNIYKAPISFNINLNNDRVAVTHIASNVNNWNYISLKPSKIYLKQVNYIIYTIIIYIVLCIIVGIILSYFLAKKQYTPLQRLIDTFIGKLGNRNQGKDTNEFSILENMLIDVLNQKKDNEKIISENNNTLRNNVLCAIIKGRIRTNSDIETLYKNYNIKFKTNRFIIMVYSLEDFSNSFFQGNMVDDQVAFDLLNSIIASVADQMINEKNKNYIVEIDGMIVCLINVTAVYESDENNTFAIIESLEIAEKSQKFIKQKFEIGMSVAISNIYDTVEGIHKAFNEALDVVEYIATLGIKEQIIQYSSIKRDPQDLFQIACIVEKEKMFLTCIKAEDYKNARTILNNIFVEYFDQNIHTLQLIKLHMSSLLNYLLVAVKKIKESIQIDFFEEIDPVNRLLNAKNIVELQKQVNYIFDSIIKYSEWKKLESYNSRDEDIISYINNNYKNPNISMGVISSEFGISGSYLSRLFKKSKGIGLLDYIHKLRIDEAKHLMKNTNISIKEIAERVGYCNSLTMTRAFRRYEGINPSDYRHVQ